MTDQPLEPQPLEPKPVPDPDGGNTPEPLTEVPGEGGFNDGEVEIEEPREDELPPV